MSQFLMMEWKILYIVVSTIAGIVVFFVSDNVHHDNATARMIGRVIASILVGITWPGLIVITFILWLRGHHGT
jgi:hypothetical protein